MLVLVFVFFNQKTAYDMRISDWSSDVCSSDLKGKKSNEIVGRGLEILLNIDHRGAVGADPLVGDGAGILIQIPDELLRAWANDEGITLPQPGYYAVAMCFLPREAAAQQAAVGHSSRVVRTEGQHLLGWRDVPVHTAGAGTSVLDRTSC